MKPIPLQSGLVVIFILFGALFTWQQRELPLVRNSLFYGDVAHAIHTEGVFSREAARRTFNKPMGFSVLAAPLVAWLGVDGGLKAASVVATAFWSLMVLLFLRRYAKDPAIVGLGLLFTFLNPLVIYQFTSAYPDTLFAGFFLLGILFLDRALSREAKAWDGSLGALAVLVGIWVKHHGFVLLPIWGVLGLIRRSDLQWQWRESRGRLWGWLGPLLGLLGILLAAQKGWVPTFNLSHNQDNFLGGQERSAIVWENLQCLGVYLWILWGGLLPIFFLGRPPWRGRSGWLWGGQLGIFISTVLFYQGAAYNIRYFLPITPLLAWWGAVRLSRLGPGGRQGLLGLFLLWNGFTILYYNVPVFQRWVHPHISLPQVDNLRLVSEQQRARENLAWMDHFTPSHDQTVIFLSRYYDGNTPRGWERAGYFADGTILHYAPYWEHELIERWHLRRAVIYEYVGVGPERNRLQRDPDIQDALQKVNDRLYLLNLDRPPPGVEWRGP
ncbi:MAG: hypothetical protein HQL52_10530 [Magnetococcales bacterium]|nr:hypothetical protein [Magnetococcales bacterium]